MVGLLLAPAALFHGKNAGTHLETAVWSAETVRTGVENSKSLPFTWIQTPKHPTRSVVTIPNTPSRPVSCSCKIKKKQNLGKEFITFQDGGKSECLVPEGLFCLTILQQTGPAAASTRLGVVTSNIRGYFDVLLTVHLSIFISVINQLDAQNFCFTISFCHASTCFEHMCSKHVEA